MTEISFAGEKPNSFSFHVNYVSASRVFPTPFSQDPILHNDSYELGSSVSYTGDYRIHLSEYIHAGVSIEYAPNTLKSTDNYNTLYVDGYRLYILELSGYFTLPIGSKSFQLYVGGGIGTYFGSREYSIAGVNADPIHPAPAFGIHISSGMEYYILPEISLRAEFIFRDPQVTFENQFPVASVMSNGYQYQLGTQPFKSKVNVNGNVYAIGFAFHF